MKKILNIICLAGVLLTACKKSSMMLPSMVASLNIINATINAASLDYKFNGTSLIYSQVATANKISFGAYALFSPVNGTNTLTLIQSTDTTHTLFQGNFNLQAGNSYSLFLVGTTTQPDTLFVHDKLPAHSVTDSTAGIRFVNLSPGSNPVSVDIKGSANGSEVASLSYKGITAFKKYTANLTVTSYIFEFRDAATGTLLTSYTLSGVNTNSPTTANTVRFKNLTIALIGQPAGGTAAQKAILINNY